MADSRLHRDKHCQRLDTNALLDELLRFRT